MSDTGEVEIIVFLLGLSVGSFLNVLIDRLPNGQTIFGRSRCDGCGRMLRWYELVPVVSWIIQGAACRRCHRLLSLQYPLIELTTAVGFLFLFLLASPSPFVLLAYFFLFSSFLVIFVADFKYQIIPDSMLVAGLAGIGLLWMTPVRSGDNPLPYLASAAGGFLFFYLIYALSRKRAMGFGDVKLSFVLGLLLGFPLTIIAFYMAFLTGAVVGVILILVGEARFRSRIAFGPFLVLGTAMALIWGESMITWWQKTI